MANILICDDDKEIVEAIEIYLLQEGYQIYKAYDGEQAIEVLKKEDIHIALDTSGVDGRRQRRSKYGAKRPKQAAK